MWVVIVMTMRGDRDVEKSDIYGPFTTREAAQQVRGAPGRVAIVMPLTDPVFARVRGE